VLYVLLAAPLVAAAIAAITAAKDADADFRLGLFLSLVVAALGVPLLWNGYPAVSIPWFSLPGTGATVHLALASDGLSAWLVQLVTWLTPLAILGSRKAVGERSDVFVTAVLAMEALMIGALLATDLAVFYLCFEGMLVPMLVLIWIFGGHDRKTSAMWFVLYTMAGSVPLVVGLWYLAAKVHSVDLSTVIAAVPNLSHGEQGWLFLAFVLAFAVKVPLIPLHGWQARTYAETPGAAVVLLAGAMAKIGTYGFIRFVLPIFPDQSAEYACWFIVLGSIGTVGGALVAIAQDDAKRMLAYSSLSHLSLVMVGIFTFQPEAMHGAAVQMVAHGLSIAALFLLVSYVEQRTGTYGVDDFGGLANRAPLLAILFVTAALASAAMPGTANFIGEFGLLLGAWKHSPWLALIVGLSVILGVVYLLILIQRWFYGREHASTATFADLGPAETLAVLPLLIASFAIGFYPAPVTSTAGVVAAKAAEPAAKAAQPKPMAGPAGATADPVAAVTAPTAPAAR
jgi:NADH-quinone oxidoreductase subunit M